MKKIGLLALGAALILSSCSANSKSSDNDSGDQSNKDELVLYTSRSNELIDPIIKKYQEKSGVTVEVKYSDASDLALLLENESKSGVETADIFLSQSPGAVGYLESLEGGSILEPLSKDVLDLVPDYAKDPNGQWVGITGRQRVLVYNPEQVTEADLPKSSEDIVDPKWKGKVGIAPTNGSFQDFVTIMRSQWGDEKTADWLKKLHDNEPKIFPKNDAIVEGVNSGQAEFGLVNHYYNFIAEDENPDHVAKNYYLPEGDPGSSFLVTSAAVLKSSDNSEQAEEFIKFMLNKDSQTFFAEDEFEYPLAKDVKPLGGIPEVDIKEAPVDLSELSGGLSKTLELISEAGFDV